MLLGEVIEHKNTLET